jgi:hypothetical protein
MNQDEYPENVITEPQDVEIEEEIIVEERDDTGEEAEIVDNPADIFSGDSRRDVIGGVADISCDVVSRSLTFTLVNIGEKIWDLDQTIGFGGDSEKINLQIFINNEEANSGTPRYDAGERLFGPSETFSENCGGVTELAPGKEVECTTFPVPLNDEDAYSNSNRIWLDLPGGDVEYVTFTCE